MTEPQLIKILTASPRLRILHLGMELSSSSEHAPPVRIRLSDLEVLNLTWMPCEEQGIVIRLLDPGTKPLLLALDVSFSAGFVDSPLYNDIKLFLAHSNVTKLYASNWNENLSLAELRDISPHVRVLALNRFYPAECLESESSSNKDQHSVTLPHLDSLYILVTGIKLDHLRCVLEQSPVHTLVLWRSSVFDDEGAVTEQEAENGLLGPVVSTVTFWDGENPIREWDVDDELL